MSRGGLPVGLVRQRLKVLGRRGVFTARRLHPGRDFRELSGVVPADESDHLPNKRGHGTAALLATGVVVEMVGVGEVFKALTRRHRTVGASDGPEPGDVR